MANNLEEIVLVGKKTLNDNGYDFVEHSSDLQVYSKDKKPGEGLPELCFVKPYLGFGKDDKGMAYASVEAFARFNGDSYTRRDASQGLQLDLFDTSYVEDKGDYFNEYKKQRR